MFVTGSLKVHVPWHLFQITMLKEAKRRRRSAKKQRNRLSSTQSTSSIADLENAEGGGDEASDKEQTINVGISLANTFIQIFVCVYLLQINYSTTIQQTFPGFLIQANHEDFLVNCRYNGNISAICQSMLERDKFSYMHYPPTSQANYPKPIHWFYGGKMKGVLLNVIFDISEFGLALFRISVYIFSARENAAQMFISGAEDEVDIIYMEDQIYEPNHKCLTVVAKQVKISPFWTFFYY